MISVANPDIGELEERYVVEAVRSGWVSSIGEFVTRFERNFAAFCETSYGIAVTNGTDALFITLKSLGIGPGDEVIVPALTFAAVPAVVSHLGAEPVIADIHEMEFVVTTAVAAKDIYLPPTTQLAITTKAR